MLCDINFSVQKSITVIFACFKAVFDKNVLIEKKNFCLYSSIVFCEFHTAATSYNNSELGFGISILDLV